MIPAYFVQTSIKDPWPLYAEMLAKHPVHYDSNNHCWAIYSYSACRQLLEHPGMIIPPVPHDALSGFALQVKNKLARLSDGSSHGIARQANRILMANRINVSIAPVMNRLLQYAGYGNELDWVEDISRKLPALVLLESFRFYDDDACYILERMDRLTRIMLPAGSANDATVLNATCEEVYLAIRRNILSAGWFRKAAAELSSHHQLKEEESLEYISSNLAGLLIQSHDAGRGLISNTLLSMLTIAGILKNGMTEDYIRRIAIETMRFNGPVHITRRITTENIIINNSGIKQGSLLILALAAANRDPDHFMQADRFDCNRHNNYMHLGFGNGLHHCPGSAFAITLAAEACLWLFGKYQHVSLLENDINHEPLVNLRIPARLLLSLA
jgi:cytochrome P450